MTLNGYYTLLHYACLFGALRVNLNELYLLFCRKNVVQEVWFLRYTGYADNYVGSLESVSDKSEVVENGDFNAFCQYILGIFRDKANIIIW